MSVRLSVLCATLAIFAVKFLNSTVQIAKKPAKGAKKSYFSPNACNVKLSGTALPSFFVTTPKLPE